MIETRCTEPELRWHASPLTRAVATCAGVVLAAALVSGLLLVTFDLDRPTRGLIEVPDTPLTDLRASMRLPPAARGPTEP